MNPLLGLLIRAVLTFFGLLVTLLPRRAELWIGPKLGYLYMRLDPRRRGIAEENIHRCLPELSPAQREDLLRQNYAHYGTLALELMHMFSPFPGHYRRYAGRTAVLEGFEHWKKAHDQGKGVLFVSAHMANWEMMAAQGAMHGMPLTMATRRLKPEWLHEKIKAVRLSVNVSAAYLPDTLPAILKALRQGESVGFVLDQYAAPPVGIPAPFFGAMVDTLAAVGTLAERYDAPIIPVTQIRTSDGVVHVRIEPELDLASIRRDPVQTTAMLSALVERWVRETPSQWLWVHRRFKNAKWPNEAPTAAKA